MENASKVILIAGAILIVLIIISIALLLIFKSELMVNIFSDNLTEEQKQSHNAQFLEYLENIIDLISKVEASNDINKFQVTLTTPHGNIPGSDAGTIISGVDKLGDYTVDSINYDSRGIIYEININ